MYINTKLDIVKKQSGGEGRETCRLHNFGLTLIQTDYSKNFTKYAKMSYDATNKRVREVEELEFGSERDFYDVLYLYNEVMKMVITKIIFLKTTTFYRALPEVMAG